MFERFNEPARRVLFFARYEASQLGSTSIDAEHLLLGLMRDTKGALARLLTPEHLSGIRQEIERRPRLREKIPASVELPFTEDARHAIQYAAEEADRLRHRQIGSDHLLLGLLRVEGAAAASPLSARGVRLDEVRHTVAATSQALTTDEITERLDLIQRLVQQLHRRFSEDADARVLFERIDEELNVLKQRLVE